MEECFWESIARADWNRSPIALYSQQEEQLDVPVRETPWEGPFPEIPNWSENFLLAGHDSKAGVGFWLHCGRWRKDLAMFRETVLVRLPDDTVVASRAIGDARSDKNGRGGP